MFRQNTRHLQPPLFSDIDQLPEAVRKRLKSSWAETFYREFFCRLDEEVFAVLYADTPSRPNVPVNVLVSLEFLKAAFGWTDEELYDHFCFDLQVRYALGYRNLGEGHFDLRSLYNFRQRLARHMAETGENLLERAFEQVTDEQLEAFALKTGTQRMDSTLLASNIRQMGRLQLLVTVVQRVYRRLSEEDQARYAEVFAPYVQGHAGQYVYRLKKADIPEHLQRIGEVIRQLLQDLEAGYGETLEYRLLARVFVEHFRLEPEGVVVKPAEELRGDILQSPDDPEATYREKGGRGHRGYVVNVAETCDPENPVQLITQVQVAPNVTDDSQLLQEALPNLKARTALETLYTDGGYGSEENDALLEEAGVTLVQTGIRGRPPDPERLHLADFQVERAKDGRPEGVECPQGQRAVVQPSRTGKSFVARFDGAVCGACPLRERCPTQPRQGGAVRALRFTWQELRRAERRRRMREHQDQSRNLRAAVEATIRSLKNPFAGGKAPVRGRFRVTCMVIGVAAVVNICRLHRLLRARDRAGIGPNVAQAEEKSKMEAQNTGGKGSIFAFVSPFLRFRAPWPSFSTQPWACSFAG